MLFRSPCTGTGTWRRNPDGRWTLSPRDLAELLPKQATILDEAQRLVKPGGRLIYVTCSVLPAEDEAQAEAFLARHPDFRPLPVAELWRESVGGEPPPQTAPRAWLRLSPLQHGTDGFFAAVFERQLPEKPEEVDMEGGGPVDAG